MTPTEIQISWTKAFLKIESCHMHISTLFRRAVEVAEAFAADRSEIHEALCEMAGQNVLVLDPGTDEIRMAMPLSAVPAP